LFFVNWAAWHRRNLGLWRRCRFELKVLAVWAFLIRERIGIATGIDKSGQDNNFTVTGAQHVGGEIRVAELFDICLAENERRMKNYDHRLNRPRVVPALAGMVRKVLTSRRSA
jgi:hypothetical protein